MEEEQEILEGSLENRRNESRKNSSERPCIKGGLLLKTAEEGRERKQGSGFPKRSLNRDFCVSLRHYPK